MYQHSPAALPSWRTRGGRTVRTLSFAAVLALMALIVPDAVGAPAAAAPAAAAAAAAPGVVAPDVTTSEPAAGPVPAEQAPRVAQDQSEQPGDAHAAALSVGESGVCVVLTSAAVRCWGSGGSGRNGIGTSVNIGDDENPTVNVSLPSTVTAVSAGVHSCALRSTGAVRCWGLNAFGQLGLGNTTNVSTPISDVVLGNSASAVSAGNNFTCAVLAAGTIRCWGTNARGQLGIGNTISQGDNELPTVNVGNITTATAVAAGGQYACALLAGGFVRCWGFNNFGQLGIGSDAAIGNIGDDELPTTNVNLGGVPAIAITAGQTHTCALLVGGAVRCWGFGAFGQLGLGNTNSVSQNPTANVNLGGVAAVAVSAGPNHTCALLTGGAVRCWGLNANGQLGLGNTTNIGDNELPTTDVPLGGLTATAVAAGGGAGSNTAGNTCVLLITGAVRCFGTNNFGQLGIANTLDQGDDELPTIDVNLGTTVGPDDQNPTVGIAFPSPGQTGVANPNTISGSATDNAGVTSVSVAIYRNVAGGQYWNGASWQSANTTVAATLATPGALSTNWTYSFAGPVGGIYATAAIAGDPAGHFAFTQYRVFSRVDSSNPAVTMTSPTNNQAFTTRPVAITGTATDNAGIADVLVSIYRPVGTGEFWNGTAWQTAYTTVRSALSNPGNTATAFTYSFNPPQSGGLFYAAAIPLDTSNRFAQTAFIPFTLPDATPPTAAITTPADGATITGPVNITGTATDNSAIYSVGIAIYQASTGNYWNGTTFIPGFRTIPATMTTPGAASTAFSYNFTAPTPGFYLIGALPIDTLFLFSLTPFTTINAT